MQAIYLCRLYIYVGYIFMQAIYLCRLYIYVGYISMQAIYLCRLYNNTGYILIQAIYFYSVFPLLGSVSAVMTTTPNINFDWLQEPSLYFQAQ